MLSASLTGDFGSLTAFGNRVGAFGSPALMKQISKEIADEALYQVQKGFSEQRDPYGNPWFPKKYSDGRKILRGSSGKLERSFVRLYAGPDAATIGSKVSYAVFAQTGTGVYGPKHQRITPKRGKALRFKSGGRWMFAKSVEGSPARMMMPSPRRNSSSWGKAFQKRVSAVLRARLSGRTSQVA
jgi:phage gpG-like protein